MIRYIPSALRSRLLTVGLALAVVLACAAVARAQTSTAPTTRSAPSAAPWARIDALVEEAIRERKLPGAVVVVGRRDEVLYRRAYGQRAVQPSGEAMTLDTIFDAASLTKVVATTTSVMQLVEQGRIRLSDRVSTYVPGFERYGKQDITIRHLLTHMSGLRPDLDMAMDWQGSDKAIELAIEEIPLAPPNQRFVYSDINFFLLGHIVARVSGQPLAEYAKAHVFAPLGMKDTMFLPPASLIARTAPTEPCTPFGWPCAGPNMRMLRGIVHDPTARRMGGVAGHAGMFTTAEDLSRFCRALLNGGTLDGRRVLAPLTVAKMTSFATPDGQSQRRGFGWDIDSSFAANRGELLPIGSFGHTGFTGTSIWIDPYTGLYVVFLSNRLHPDGKGDVTPLRAKVATVAATSITDVPAFGPESRPGRMTGTDFVPPAAPAPRPSEPVLTGIDVLRAENFARLQGRKVGLVTNHTGRAADGTSTIDLLFGAKNLQLVTLFSPEHGIRGILDENVPSARDEKTGLVIHSLYGQTRRPTDEMLKGIDTMVIDLQDIGSRFYTYTATMGNVMEEAAKRNIEVVVLDRPNPVNGFHIEGPTLDRELMAFVGYFQMPTRHGLTLGELARLFNAEKSIKAKLTVVEMKHWTRETWFDETGLSWINPSPNMRNMLQATLYTGIGSIEFTNISVGRGTDTPFEQIGAPWIDGVALARAMNARQIPGIRFYPVSFTPTSSKYKDQVCQGVFIIVTDRLALRPVRVGLELASALTKLHPKEYKVDPADKLLGSKTTVTRMLAGEDPAEIAASWASDEARWRLLRAKYLLYE